MIIWGVKNEQILFDRVSRSQNVQIYETLKNTCGKNGQKMVKKWSFLGQLLSKI